MKQKRNRSRDTDTKLAWLDRVELWFECHPRIAKFLDYSMFLISAIAIGCLVFGSTFIPKSLQEMNYVFPLYLNLVLGVNLAYHRIIRARLEKRITVEGFTMPFLYLNGAIFLLHLVIGLNGQGSFITLPPLYELDKRYIWFPIGTYMLFFFLGLVLLLLAKHLEKKKLKK